VARRFGRETAFDPLERRHVDAHVRVLKLASDHLFPARSGRVDIMADGDVNFGITPAPDGQLTRLETFINGESVSWVDLDGPGLDWLIAKLAAARAGLAEPVPDTLDPEAQLEVTEYPSWWVFDPDAKGRTLALRHPGLGWLGFLLGQDDATEIAGWLSKT
jgi:hypothetical protein